LKKNYMIFVVFTFRRDGEINSLNSRLEDEQSHGAALNRKIKELQVINLPTINL